jgi:hypothetical protein
MKQVLVVWPPEEVERRNLRYLSYTAKEQNSDLSFKALHEIAPGISLEGITAENLCTTHGVVWAPSPRPNLFDWFERLQQQGYQGRKILVYSSEALNTLKQHADAVVALEPGKTYLAILDALKSQRK